MDKALAEKIVEAISNVARGETCIEFARYHEDAEKTLKNERITERDRKLLIELLQQIPIDNKCPCGQCD